MKNFKIKTSFVRPEGPKARANKIGINFMIFLLLGILGCLQYNTIHHFQYSSEPVLIQRILIGFEAILENKF